MNYETPRQFRLKKYGTVWKYFLDGMDTACEDRGLIWADELEDFVALSEHSVDIHLELPVMCVM